MNTKDAYKAIKLSQETVTTSVGVVALHHQHQNNKVLAFYQVTPLVASSPLCNVK